MRAMIRKMQFIPIVIILVTSSAGQSQATEDMIVIVSHNPPDSLGDSTNNNKSQVKIPTNPEELVSMSIKIYQYFISSQDMPSCVFTPSCSRFAEQSIYKFGILKGLLLTSDRLQRCHRFDDKSDWYTFNFSKNRFNDPVGRYGEIK